MRSGVNLCRAVGCSGALILGISLVLFGLYLFSFLVSGLHHLFVKSYTWGVAFVASYLAFGVMLKLGLIKDERGESI